MTKQPQSPYFLAFGSSFCSISHCPSPDRAAGAPLTK
jgi:hypothetical protein